MLRFKRRLSGRSGRRWRCITGSSNLHLRQFFAGGPLRGERLGVEAGGLCLDYSKNRATDETIALVVQLAGECSLRERIDALFSGATINETERCATGRAAGAGKRAHATAPNM